MADSTTTALRELAQSHGIQTHYTDMSGAEVEASARSLVLVLKALGVDLASEQDAPQALQARKLELQNRRLEPVLLCWEDADNTIEVSVSDPKLFGPIACRLALEGGAVREWTARLEPGNSSAKSTPRLTLPVRPPTGFHDLTLVFPDGARAEALILAAPRQAYRGRANSGQRTWGIFSPLYSLRKASSWGGGDLSDLEALIQWTSGLGGGLVASLPMLASTFDGPTPIISPYSPTSRLFWNEFYLDLQQIPELAKNEPAQTLMKSAEFDHEVAVLQAGGLVEYGRQHRLKRLVLEELADGFFQQDSPRRRSFEDFANQHPDDLGAYAYFQAAGERHGRNWREWPDPSPGSNNEVDARSVRYHQYVQWLMDEQLGRLARQARDQGLDWYLDFPVGVDHNSFDVWKNREVFARGASVGCPPDPIFTKGQNWGFPPLDPEKHRRSGYCYLRASIKNHLRYASALRIDHVMGLHRLFWIPDGAEARDGAFVSTPAEELYAVLSIESHRQQSWLVGEDLGTVPPEVEGAMKQHAIRGMYVVQYEVRPDPEQPLREAPGSTVASVNTHDMPPFAAFWTGADLEDRMDLGLLNEAQLEVETETRKEQRQALVGFLQEAGLLRSEVGTGAESARPVLQALWEWLAGSPSSVVLVNVEDLWLETESQNTPNTYLERPNWQRKLRRSFEDFSADPAILQALRRVNELRQQPPRPEAALAKPRQPGKGREVESIASLAETSSLKEEV